MTLALILDSAGFGEWFILLAVVLIVVGPRKLPSTARKLGSYYAKFRRAAESFKRQLLDMETEMTRVMDSAENSVSEAFKVEGNEASAVPSTAGDVVAGEAPPVTTEPPAAEQSADPSVAQATVPPSVDPSAAPAEAVKES